MKKLSLLIILILGGTTTQVVAQQINSNITSSYYLANPKAYLSKLDNYIIPSNILLDRAIPTAPIANFSGSGTVLTGTFTEWSKLFFEQMNGTAGGYNMDAWLAQEKAYLHRVRDEEIVPIIIQNMKYAKVSTQALSSGLLYEQDSFLVENATYKAQILNANETQKKQLIANLYTTHRTFAASTVYGRIHGNSITFALDSNFYFSNIKNEIIESVEIDFGNGTGYQYIDWNTPITIKYARGSAFIECAVKFNILDNTNTPQTLYAHFTVLRTGDDVVPNVGGTTNGRTSSTPIERFYFPDGPTGTSYLVFYKEDVRQSIPAWVELYMLDNLLPGEIAPVQTFTSRQICAEWDQYGCTRYEDEFFEITGMYYLDIFKADNANLEVTILYAPNNTSGKLRKPLLMVDGFDPGNTRDYYSTNCKQPCDPRGLFEVMNGDLHPYYEESKTSNTIQKLRENNYDLVFVDFLVGDDSITTNGDRVIDLLNYLNSPNYRNEYTEEMVVVGPSMGGLITRYALKTMENRGIPHYVRQWISFDSPHEGANVPLALQYTLEIMNDNNRIRNNANPPTPAEALNTLNSPAARQMLMAHYNNNTADLTNFYNTMHTLGYPEQCEKIAISNGSTGELYPTNDQHYMLGSKNIYGTLIIQFHHYFAGSHIIGVKLKDQTTSYRITVGQRIVLGVVAENYPRDAINTLSLDNIPGGIIDQLKQINYNDDNGTNFAKGIPHYNLSTFIPMLSAFGVPVTRANVNNWNTALLTSPFDKTRSMLLNDPGLWNSEGLYGGNQFHITITDSTRNYVLGQMEGNKTTIQVPFVHASVAARTQVITAKVAYNGVQSVTFCKANGNDRFILEPTAAVTATAPESITFNTGFHAKAGSSFSAKIVNTNGGRVSNSVVSTTTPINYATTSTYSNNKHSYASLVKNNKLLANVENSTASLFSVYPTISNGIYKIANQELGEYSVEVINSLGQSIIPSTPNLEKIDIASQNSGFYFVRILSENKSYLFKILKE